MDQECEHTDIENGPRVPARWGTFPTQVCKQCGMWRVNAHRYGPWREQPMPDAKDDDES